MTDTTHAHADSDNTLTEQPHELSTDQLGNLTPMQMQQEILRLREHTGKLLLELKTERKAHKLTQDSANTGGETAEQWKARYYDSAVVKPLEAELEAIAGLPMRYLKDICIELGVLKFAPDLDGLQRPQWIGLDGKEASLDKGLHCFLADIHAATNNSELGRALRPIGTSGSGASSSTNVRPAAPEPAPTKTAKKSYGIR